jgi:hypothetical protein
MRRAILLALMLAIGGAIINIAVAWGCALWANDPSHHEAANDADVTREWPEAAPLSWTDEALVVSNSNWAITEITAVGGVRISTAVIARMYILEAGIPWRALNRIVCQDEWAGESLDAVARHEPTTWKEGMAVPERLDWLDRQFRGVLPVLPIWPGFAINTIVYAGILWLLFAAPFVVRRRRRIKRGLCPTCAYPIGSSDLCTECGRPVSPKRRGELAT